MLALDCEFDGHKGSLLSMALVSDDGDEFYEVLHFNTRLDVWVLDNVIPFLGKKPIDLSEFKTKLIQFLHRHPNETIVADSPADFWYLMDMCHEIDSNGKYHYISLDLRMHFRISGAYSSKIPHNALEDARALHEYLKRLPS